MSSAPHRHQTAPFLRSPGTAPASPGATGPTPSQFGHGGDGVEPLHIEPVADIPLRGGALLCIVQSGEGWAVTVATPHREDAMAAAALAMAVLGDDGEAG